MYVCMYQTKFKYYNILSCYMAELSAALYLADEVMKINIIISRVVIKPTNITPRRAWLSIILQKILKTYKYILIFSSNKTGMWC